MRTNPAHFAILGAALLALAACDKPKSRNPNDQGGPLGATGATSNPGAQAAAPAAAPVKPTTTTDPLPALPKWSAAYVGKPLKDVFADQGAPCIGNTDLIGMRYTGAASTGVRVEGWGWDTTGKKAVARILLVDDAGKVVGAGETGLPRPDVAAARKDITSPTTGWQAYTAQSAGGVYAFGLVGEKAVCRLGHINL
jgi:hypothetical protein